MKKFQRKALVLLVCTVLLAFAGVGGTVAFLKADTDDLTNTFTPAQVDTKIEEKFDNGAKSSITVENKNDPKNIPVYVRVAIYANWVDASGSIVAPWEGTVSYKTDKWELGTDGFYYYKSILDVGDSTENLLSAAIKGDNPPAGADHLEVSVVHQAIQAEPASAVTEAWKWTPPASGE